MPFSASQIVEEQTSRSNIWKMKLKCMDRSVQKVTTMFIRKNKIALLIKILQFIHIFNLTENNSKVHYYCIFLAINNFAQCVLEYIKITFKGLDI